MATGGGGRNRWNGGFFVPHVPHRLTRTLPTPKGYRVTGDNLHQCHFTVYRTRRNRLRGVRYLRCECGERTKHIVPLSEIGNYRVALPIAAIAESDAIGSTATERKDKAIGASSPEVPMSYLTLASLAERFAIHPTTLSRLCRAGQFVKPLRIGNSLRFDPAAVAEWERRQKGLADVQMTDAAEVKS